MAAPSLETLQVGGKRALAQALAALEAEPDAAATLDLLEAADRAARAHTVGLTGPPGVGKSTLTGALIDRWRAAGERVAVIAVDPSSKRTRGALLGDRTRLRTDPLDDGVFVRSMAARDRLGGLADLTVAALVVMRALYDRVLVETVGVGQSETDVAGVVDTVVLCIQPGSGDSLQFMKAGIVEIPQIVVVTKADMGQPARQAQADLASALELADPGPDDWPVAALGLSAQSGEGIEGLTAAINRHRDWLAPRLAAQRQAQAEQWLAWAVRDRWGREGLRRVPALAGRSAFRVLAGLTAGRADAGA